MRSLSPMSGLRDETRRADDKVKSAVRSLSPMSGAEFSDAERRWLDGKCTDGDGPCLSQPRHPRACRTFRKWAAKSEP